MFVGHYGPSFAGKAADQRIPLWLLFVAVQFVDVLWAIFVLLGIEKVRIVPGITASSPLDLYYMPYTHSLAAALGWSLLAFVAWQTASRLRGAHIMRRLKAQDSTELPFVSQFGEALQAKLRRKGFASPLVEDVIEETRHRILTALPKVGTQQPERFNTYVEAVCDKVILERYRERVPFPTSGWIVAAAVFSHWILDLIVHRPDLPLYDSLYKMGFGLWNYRVPAFILEMVVLFGGAALYVKTVPRKGKVIIYVALLAVLQFIATFVLPPPSSDRAEALSALFFYFLLAAIAWWVERGQGLRAANSSKAAGMVS